jgi:hypothetical protein
MTQSFLSPEDTDGLFSARFLNRLDALHRETLAPKAGHPGLFSAGTRRKRLFH